MKKWTVKVAAEWRLKQVPVICLLINLDEAEPTGYVQAPPPPV